MEIEKERLSKSMFFPKWVLLEHLARYNFVAKFTRNKLVIDCACGDGLGTKIMYNSKPQLIKAFDISPTAIKKAKELLNRKNVEFKVSDAIKLDLPKDFADIYVSLETIEHIPKDRNYLQEVVRILKINGTYICSTPNRIVTNPGKKLNDKPMNKYHIREYSPVELLTLLKRYFKNVTFFGQNPNHFTKVKFLEILSKLLTFNLAVRTHQFIKMMRYIFYFQRNYEVQTFNNNNEFELLLCVCRNPIK